MGHVVNPVGLKIYFSLNWPSSWFTRLSLYSEFIQYDLVFLKLFRSFFLNSFFINKSILLDAIRISRFKDMILFIIVLHLGLTDEFILSFKREKRKLWVEFRFNRKRFLARINLKKFLLKLQRNFFLRRKERTIFPLIFYNKFFNFNKKMEFVLKKRFLKRLILLFRFFSFKRIYLIFFKKVIFQVRRWYKIPGTKARYRRVKGAWIIKNFFKIKKFSYKFILFFFFFQSSTTLKKKVLLNKFIKNKKIFIFCNRINLNLSLFQKTKKRKKKLLLKKKRFKLRAQKSQFLKSNKFKLSKFQKFNNQKFNNQKFNNQKFNNQKFNLFSYKGKILNKKNFNDRKLYNLIKKQNYFRSLQNKRKRILFLKKQLINFQVMKKKIFLKKSVVRKKYFFFNFKFLNNPFYLKKKILSIYKFFDIVFVRWYLIRRSFWPIERFTKVLDLRENYLNIVLNNRRKFLNIFLKRKLKKKKKKPRVFNATLFLRRLFLRRLIRIFYNYYLNYPFKIRKKIRSRILFSARKKSVPLFLKKYVNLKRLIKSKMILNYNRTKKDLKYYYLKIGYFKKLNPFLFNLRHRPRLVLFFNNNELHRYRIHIGQVQQVIFTIKMLHYILFLCLLIIEKNIGYALTKFFKKGLDFNIAKVKLLFFYGPSSDLIAKYILIKLRQGFTVNETIYPLIRKILKHYRFLLGIKIQLFGRFRRRQRKKHYRFLRGWVPLSRVYCFVEYSYRQLLLLNGTCGLKVWLSFKFDESRHFIQDFEF